jgi:hypothetical protein
LREKLGFIAPETGQLALLRFPRSGVAKTTPFSLCPLSPNAPASSTQANWADRADFNSTSPADFSELLAAQGVRCRVFKILKSRGSRKRGQNFGLYLLAPQRLAMNREK